MRGRGAAEQEGGAVTGAGAGGGAAAAARALAAVVAGRPEPAGDPSVSPGARSASVPHQPPVAAIGSWGRRSEQQQQSTPAKEDRSLLQRLNPWSSRYKQQQPPPLSPSRWLPPWLPALRRGNWAVEELEEYEYEEDEDEDGGGLSLPGGMLLSRGALSLAARMLAVAAVVLALAFAPPPVGRGGGSRGFLGALGSGSGFLRRLLGRGEAAYPPKSLPGAAGQAGGGLTLPRLPEPARARPKLGDPAQLSTLGGCLRALDHHVRAEDAPAVFEALREMTCEEQEGLSLSTLMAVEDWLGDWLARRPPPPPDLIPLALDYTRALLAAQHEGSGGEEGGGGGGSSTRAWRRGTALERLLMQGPFTALLLGPDSLARYGGQTALVPAARALAAFTHVHAGLRRRLLGASLRLWARVGEGEGEGEAGAVDTTWTPAPPPRGLRNQGNTCYLNSLLQQLVHLQACREGVLVGDGGEEEGDAAGGRLWGELRRVLGALSEPVDGGTGQQRGVETRRLVEAMEGALDAWGPAVWEQNDATELLMLLLERLEKGPGADLAACFTGRLQTRIYHAGCGHERRKPQAFVTVPLPVKGMRGLQDALLAWTQGEEVHEGKACKQCGAVSALRHEETLLDLPPVLALQLQRFEDGGAAKVQGRFAFPETVDMYPYTAEGKARREEDPSELEENDDGEVVPREWYRLEGVLMHRGWSPQEGHYYSYARRGEGGGWWCLNDEVVAPFDVGREAERAWFRGGVDSPFILLYARDDEGEEEGSCVGDSVGEGEEGEEAALAAHPVVLWRLEAVSALVAGVAQATLKTSLVAPAEMQRLFVLVHWLAASAAAAAKVTGLYSSGSDEVLHEVKAAGSLLRRRLLESASTPVERERDALAVWLVRRLAAGWLADVFGCSCDKPDGDGGEEAHAAVGRPLRETWRKVWAGVAEAAVDRVASLGGEKAEGAMDALAAAVVASPGLREDGGSAALVERLRPRLEGSELKGGGDGDEGEDGEGVLEDLDEGDMEGGEGGGGGGGGGGGRGGRPFADAG